jgi:Zn finger protein HypA/HybF involved in hydrogenase expression
MHEMSVALEVCRLAEERLGREALGGVVAVGVEVGDDAGVEPESLAFCLEAVLSTPPFRGAKPVISRHPGDVLRLSYLEVDDGRPDD